MNTSIGTLRESSLHAQLKQLYACPGDIHEANIGGMIIDIVRGDRLIEIQTGDFGALKKKLERLLDLHIVQIVYPLPLRRTILRIAKSEGAKSKRLSPKMGRIEDIFSEMVRLARYAKHPNFLLHVILIEDEIILVDDGKGSWRRKGWSVYDRRLIKVVDSRSFHTPFDYASLLPGGLDSTFTSVDLAREAKLRPSLARKMLFSLREMGVINLIGKRGRLNCYARCVSE